MVLKKISNEQCFIIPITTTDKHHLPGYFKYKGKDYLVFEQAKSIDARRLMNRIETVPKSKFKEIKEEFVKYISS